MINKVLRGYKNRVFAVILSANAPVSYLKIISMAKERSFTGWVVSSVGPLPRSIDPTMLVLNQLKEEGAIRESVYMTDVMPKTDPALGRQPIYAESAFYSIPSRTVESTFQ